ncbi:hypothetical protein B0H19DRAFT_1331323 [Mycena capillaripes]|nr:hypothetical protein B0H19DRAFT_1331323 [Mycena capillaripes]
MGDGNRVRPQYDARMPPFTFWTAFPPQPLRQFSRRAPHYALFYFKFVATQGGVARRQLYVPPVWLPEKERIGAALDQKTATNALAPTLQRRDFMASRLDRAAQRNCAIEFQKNASFRKLALMQRISDLETINSDVTRHRAEIFRKYSNLSRVTRKIWELEIPKHRQLCYTGGNAAQRARITVSSEWRCQTSQTVASLPSFLLLPRIC